MTRSTLFLFFWICSAAFGQVKMLTEHKLIPRVTSPFEVSLEGNYEHVHWWLDGEVQSGASVTFEAEPGLHELHVYGLVWSTEGELLPSLKQASQVLVVAAGQSQELEGWGEELIGESAETAALPTPITKRPAVPRPKPYEGYTIQVKTRLGDAKTAEWMKTESGIFEEEGATVKPVYTTVTGDKVPQFRVMLDSDRTKYTPWTMRTMNADEFARHKNGLDRAAASR